METIAVSTDTKAKLAIREGKTYNDRIEGLLTESESARKAISYYEDMLEKKLIDYEKVSKVVQEAVLLAMTKQSY